MCCSPAVTRRGRRSSSTWKCFTTASVVIPRWGSYPRLTMNGRITKNSVNFVPIFRGEAQSSRNGSEPSSGAPDAEVRSRFNKKGWGRIVGGILAVAGRPDFLANADTAAAELDDVRREFADLVAALADHPQGTWTAAELAELVEKEGLFLAE